MNTMQKMLSRPMWKQWNFILTCTKVNQHEMVLYNEKPQSSMSLVVPFDANKELCLPDQLRDIRSRGSKTLCSSSSRYFIFHTNSAGISIPVIEERVDSEETPVITLVDIVKWLAKTPDSDNKDPAQSGTRLGRLDAANEAGFFHRTNRSKLKEIKKKLKDKVDAEPTEPKKSG